MRISGRPLHNLAEASAFLDSLILPQTLLHGTRARAPLYPVTALLERIGNPQQSLKIIHIAGSKGKGSTALLCEAMLRAAGLSVGTYTSPHLSRWTERIRLNGVECDEAAFVAVLERLRPVIEDLWVTQPDNPPSVFDVLTAAALLLFAEAGVAAVVLETGLGGRTDATNVVMPQVTCITSIELEHVERLGPTLADIAWEKAGIIKPGVPVVVGNLPAAALAVTRAQAQRQAAPLLQLEQGFQVQIEQADWTGTQMQLSGPGYACAAALPIPGSHLARNAALAAACVQQLGLLSGEALNTAIRQGLAGAQLPGRSEILSRQPWIMVDAAHTPASAQALAEVIKGLPVTGVHLLLSVSVGKNLTELCPPLLQRVRSVTVTRADPLRSVPPATLAAVLRAYDPQLTLIEEDDPVQAVRLAYRQVGADELLCATGSVYMAGLAREELRRLSSPVAQPAL